MNIDELNQLIADGQKAHKKLEERRTSQIEASKEERTIRGQAYMAGVRLNEAERLFRESEDAVTKGQLAQEELDRINMNPEDLERITKETELARVCQETLDKFLRQYGRGYVYIDHEENTILTVDDDGGGSSFTIWEIPKDGSEITLKAEFDLDLDQTDELGEQLSEIASSFRRDDK